MSEHRFKPGDEVICTDATMAVGRLKRGNIYVVEEYKDSCISFKGSDDYWAIGRFIPAPKLEAAPTGARFLAAYNAMLSDIQSQLIEPALPTIGIVLSPGHPEYVGPHQVIFDSTGTLQKRQGYVFTECSHDWEIYDSGFSRDKTCRRCGVRVKE